MATYSPEEYAAHLNENIRKLQNAKKEYQEAVFGLVVQVDKRIFDQGKDNKGDDIGTYSTKPLYVNPSLPTNRKKFTPKGKDPKSKSVFKNKKPRKTRFFENYTAYKKMQGIATLGNKVNLQITKHFRRAFLTKAFPITGSGDIMFITLGVRPSTVNPIGKLMGIMEHRYPHAFKFTKEEKSFIIEELRRIFITNMNK